MHVKDHWGCPSTGRMPERCEGCEHQRDCALYELMVMWEEDLEEMRRVSPKYWSQNV